MTRDIIRMLLVLVPVVLVGCSSSVPAPARSEVKGKVALADGKPPVDVVVVFNPQGPGMGSDDFSLVATDGSFSATLLDGKYNVTVEPAAKRMAGGGKTSKYPVQYASTDKTPIKLELPADSGKPLNIDLK